MEGFDMSKRFDKNGSTVTINGSMYRKSLILVV